MPISKLKVTFDYCKSNPIGFSILLIALFAINYLNENHMHLRLRYEILFFLSSIIITTIIYGYGIVITRDTIRNGKKLPKIKLKETLIEGVKCLIVTTVYTTIQSILLIDLARRFYFPEFELENALVNIMDTLRFIYVNDTVLSIEFIILSIIITYITVFFMEISLARLADGGSLLGAFNLLEIKRCIDTIGWRNYTIDYTKILFAIVILIYLQFGMDVLGFFDYVFDLIFGLLMFIIEFIGIGMIYREYKIKKYSNLKRPSQKMEKEEVR